MGQRLLGPNVGNPVGHFGDVEFLELHERSLGSWRRPNISFEPVASEYEKLIRQRKQLPLWGVKDPRLCFVFPYFYRLARVRVKAIRITRSIEASAASLSARDAMSFAVALDITQGYLGARDRSFALVPESPRLSIVYEELVAAPSKQVQRVAEFVGVPVTRAAIDFVDPTLRHY